jgi:hypothetical protein
MKRIALLAMVFCLSPGLAGASLISSTAAGGFWAVGSSWVGGVVPGPGDDVIIAGPVHVTGAQSCASLQVDAAGLLRSASSGPASLSVAGAVANAGQIANGSSPYTAFTLEVGGDLSSGGTWANVLTRITGSDERHLSQEAGAVFTSDLVYAAGAAGDLLVDTPFAITGDLELGLGRLVLGAACPLTVSQGRVIGELRMNGNALYAENYSYLQNATLDAAVLHGAWPVAGSAHFTGGLTLMGQLSPSNTSGGGHATIEGGLINEGLITNTTYGLTMEVAGNIVNNGVINNSWVQLDGASVHHLSMGPDGLFDASMFLPEFQGGDIVADTPLRFRDGLSLAGGTLTLAPGADLTFIGWGSVGSGTLYANGNTIDMHGYSSLGDLTIDQAVLTGTVQIGYDTNFTGGLTVADTLQGWPTGFGTAEVEVAGLLANEGLIRDSAQVSILLRILGDLENQGAIECERVEVAGDENQAIGAGPGIAAPEVVLESGLVADSYQWFKDGQLLPGEMGAQLILAGVSSADYGLYHCEAEGGTVLSRTIAIAEFADPTAAPAPPASARLAQNHPNPFNPATEIAFSLAAAGSARLSVHDLAGREVAVLVDGPLGAGEHRLTWRPEGLASGIYLYRLAAGGVERVGKCTLLK